MILRKLRLNISVIIIGVLLFMLWIFANFGYSQLILNTNEKSYGYETGIVVSELEDKMNDKFQFANSIRAFVIANGTDGFSREVFYKYAEENDALEKGIVSIAIAPKDQRSYVYPAGWDYSNLGYDYLLYNAEKLKIDLEKTKALNETVVNGPYALTSGGPAVTINSPIYIDGNYWGHIEVVLALEAIINESGILEKDEVQDIAIYNEEEIVIYGYKITGENIKQKEIVFGNRTWRVDTLINNEEELLTKDETKSGFKIVSLIVIILALLVIMYFTSKNEKLSNEIFRKIYYDELTKLPNRRSLEHKVKNLFSHKKSFYLAFADLDNFKYINDTLGHSLGDRLLVEISEIIRSTNESIDVYRWGGDEFIIIVSGESEEKSKAAFEEIMAKFIKPVKIDNHSNYMSMSLGVVNYPKDGTTIDELVRKADLAMYRVKDAGRNNIKYFDEEDHHITYEFAVMDQKLKASNFVNGLRTYYQPKVDVVTGKIRGVETLVRWIDADKKMVFPDSFIPVAETNGEIEKIERFTIRKAFQDIKYLNEKYGRNLKASINLSSRNFNWETIEYFEMQSAQTGVNLKNIEIEITETVGIQNFEETKKMLDHISEIGVSIALDDFGKGYSSLTYLSKLPISTVKIDKEFIFEVPHSDQDCKIVESVILLARILNLEVVAEGVEGPEQLKYLQRHKCDQYQGYHFSKAVTLDAIEKMLKEE